MSDPSLDPEPLVAVAEEFLERLRRGEHPGLSEYTRRYPELADQILDIFPALVDLERLGLDVAKTDPAVGGVAPEHVGGYRILREVGRGGMGVVYEAIEETLGRRVALKVLPSHALEQSAQRERFELEARAAARLDHPNIVPVYGVGRHDGLLYYAMRFITGLPLDGVLKELRTLRSTLPSAGPTASTVARGLASGLWSASRPASPDGPEIDRAGRAGGPDEPSWLSGRPGGDYFRAVAGISLQVAEALAYAHAQGVVHRDVKPSNLLLDDSGRPWVADFGLAKLDGVDGPTRTGDLVGTLRYMAPERFDGWSDPRSDVYGLGATLYELTTLRPAFDAPGAGALIDRIRSEDPPAPRSIDRRIPRDLETIVLKAMAKEPSSRYPTAGAMAEDLRRFAADRPILSRRDSAVERLSRWHRRNRLAAGLLWTLAAVLVGGLAGMTWLYLESDRQRLGSELSFHEAHSAVDELLTRVSESRLLARPGLEPLRKELLDAALAYYKRFDARRSDDPTVRSRLAWAFFSAGRLALQMGSPAEAEPSLRRSLELRRQLLAARPGDPRLRLELAQSEHQLGDALGSLGRWPEGLAQLGRSCERFEELRRSATVPEAPAQLAETLNCLGNLQSDAGLPADAAQTYGRVVAFYESEAAEHPDDPRPRRGLGAALCNHGTALERIGRQAEAQASYRRAIDLLGPLFRDDPGDLVAGDGLGSAFTNLGTTLPIPSQSAEAERLLRDAVEVFKALVRDHPDIAAYRRHLARGFNNLAGLLRDTGRPSEALDAWRLADQQLVAISDPTPTDLFDLLRTRSQAVAVAPEATLAGRPLADAAVEALRRLIESDPGYIRFPEQQAVLDPIRDRPDAQALLARPRGSLPIAASRPLPGD